MGSPWSAADSSAAMSEPPAISCTESATAANHRRRAYSREGKSNDVGECTKADSTSYHLTTCHRQPQESLSDSSHHSFKPLRIIVKLVTAIRFIDCISLKIHVIFRKISPQLVTWHNGVWFHYYKLLESASFIVVRLSKITEGIQTHCAFK